MGPIYDEELRILATVSMVDRGTVFVLMRRMRKDILEERSARVGTYERSILECCAVVNRPKVTTLLKGLRSALIDEKVRFSKGSRPEEISGEYDPDITPTYGEILARSQEKKNDDDDGDPS